MPAEDRNRGSIALLALWSVALIAMLLASANFTTHGETLIVRNALAATAARLAAEAGTQIGLARLLRRRAESGAGFNGTPETWHDGSTSVDIAIVDEAGKIDLNLASVELLAGLFTAVGRPPEEALLLACNVLARRGDLAASCPEVVNGMTGRARRYDVPEQLAQVPGIDDTLFDAVADYVTTATGATAIAPAVASRTALLAVPGATASLVDNFLSQRATLRGLVPDDIVSQLANSPFLMLSPNRDFTIKAVATAPGGARFRADLQVRLTTELPNHPYEVRAWRSPPTDRGQTPPAPPRRVP
jgi:general secretion pathway protein K